MIRHTPWLLLLLLTAGCAVTSPEHGPDPVSDAPSEQSRETPDNAPERAAPAVVALLEQAETASTAGDHQRAAALLERALRIEPTNAVLWHNLAVVRYREANYSQAESMAMRSNRYAAGKHQLLTRNWQLIAVSRELSGNTQGAEEARKQAAALRLEASL